MTKHALEYRALEEEKRANKEREQLNRFQAGFNAGKAVFDEVKDIVSTIVSFGGGSKQDASWYTRGGESGSSYQFTWQSSFRDIINPSGNVDSNTPDGEYLTNPYLCILEWYPTIGTRPGENTTGVYSASPIVSAINKFFTENRKANSGAKNYDATDYYQWILGYDSVVTALGEAWRAYKLTNLCATKENWYYRTMVQQLGWNYDDLKDNLANFHTAFCNILKDLNSLDVPAGLAYIEKHKVMAESIFRDEELGKCHYYAFVCPEFYIYNELNAELSPYAGFANNNDWKTNLNLIRTLLRALSTGTTRVMSGDTGKWDVNLLKFAMPDAADTMVFNGDKNWLLEIHNATVVGEPDDTSELSISQSYDGESLYQGRCATTGSRPAYGITISSNSLVYDQNNTSSESTFNGMKLYLKGALINCYEDNPSLDTQIDITKMTASLKTIHTVSGSTHSNRLVVDAHGSEIITKARICGAITAGSTHGYSFGIYENCVLTATSFFVACAAMARFNYFPHINILMVQSGITLVKSSFNAMQAGNFTFIPTDTLGEQYRTAILSLLAYTGGNPGKAEARASTKKKDDKSKSKEAK